MRKLRARLLMIDLDRTDNRLRAAARGLAMAGVAILLLQALSIVADAGARWLFALPLHAMEDVNSLVISVTIASFMPVLFMERGNITITLLGRATGGRATAGLDLFGQMLALVYIVVLAWQYGAYAADLGGRHTVIIELPKWPAAWTATGFLGITAFLQLMVVMHTAVRALNRSPATVGNGH